MHLKFLIRLCLHNIVWRSLTNSNSMATKIIKEKYFKNGKLLEAKLGGGP